MVLPAASAVSPLTLTVPSSKSRVHQLCNSFSIYNHMRHASITCLGKFPRMEHVNNPNKLIVFLNHTKEKLWRFVPGSVKQFPWKEAESVALRESLDLGKETLKWCLLTCFAFSCVSDIVNSISRNKELVIPFGLFVGMLMTKFFVEISQELVHDYKDGLIKRVGGVSCFFVVLKVMSAWFYGSNDFVLHVANGGLMQALWNWKEFSRFDREKACPDDDSTSVSGFSV